MEYRPLGNTGIDVSVICLGTMTFGEQNTFPEAAEQLDYALDQGVNFMAGRPVFFEAIGEDLPAIFAR